MNHKYRYKHHNIEEKKLRTEEYINILQFIKYSRLWKIKQRVVWECIVHMR